MESAGKRTTRSPDFLHNAVLFSGDNMATTTSSSMSLTTSTVSVTSASPTMTTSSQSSTTGSSDVTLQRLFAQLMAETKASSAKIDKKIDDYQKQSSDQFKECMKRWQLTDTRLFKLEESSLKQGDELTYQKIKNEEVSNRLNYLEGEVLSIRNELSLASTKGSIPVTSDLSQILAPTPLTSTTVPMSNANIPTSSALPTNSSLSYGNQNMSVPMTVFDPSRSSFLGSPERLQDAVSEFNGSIKIVHPEKFLNQLDIYFENVSLSPAQQLVSAQRRLVDDALIWYESLIPTPRSYSEFRDMFRQYFWSAAIQRKSRNDVFRPYRYDRPNGLAAHAMQWISSAKYLSPPIDQTDLISTIIQHYPTPLGMAIRATRPRTTNELLSILTEFEESTSFCETSRTDHRPRPPFHNNQSQNRNHGQNNRRDRNGNNSFPPLPIQHVNQVPEAINHLNVLGNDQGPRT